MRQLRNLLLATFWIPLMVLVSVLSAGSQTAPSSQSSAPPTVSALAASDIQGLDVFGSDGQQVGKIAKVNVTDKAVKNVEVQSGGFLGFFSKTYLLPADKLSKKGGRVELSMTSEQAKQFIK
jgi:sporulation protein YlmC with PRC-barrel domain